MFTSRNNLPQPFLSFPLQKTLGPAGLASWQNGRVWLGSSFSGGGSANFAQKQRQDGSPKAYGVRAGRGWSS